MIPITVREQALLRNSRRYGDSTIQFRGWDAIVEFTQELFSEDGKPDGVAIIIFRGKRNFGRFVTFEAPVTIETRNARPEDEPVLYECAQHIVGLFGKLCNCGHFKEHCDCCSHCKGTGREPDGMEGFNVGNDCLKCHGEGYVRKPTYPSGA